MATVSFATLGQKFDVGGLLASFSGGTHVTKKPSWFSWVSDAGHGVELSGSGFTYDKLGRPLTGKVGGFTLDLGHDGEFTSSGVVSIHYVIAELTVSGLSLDLTRFAPLVNGGLTVEQQNNLLWRTVLSGSDEIDVTGMSISGGPVVRFAGDGRNVESGQTLTGATDHIFGSINPNSDLPVNLITGDYFDIAYGAAASGGNDTISLANGTLPMGVFGDARSVYGRLTGGNDILTPHAIGLFSSYYTTGDADSVQEGGLVVGGRDTIDLTAGGYGAVGDVGYVFGKLIAGDDIITGSSGDNVLEGDAFEILGGEFEGGDDTIHGAGGADLIYGDWSASVETGAEGGDDKLYGDGGDDTIEANGGDDLIDGGGGADTMRGGRGNDSFVVDDLGDKVIEVNETGRDKVESSVTFSLAGQYIEELLLTGAGESDATGNSLDNTITGNKANNTIDGGKGADTMAGKAGDDLYYVDKAGDDVVEANETGYDTVKSAVTYGLAGRYVEFLDLTGSADVNATGNTKDNKLYGNDGANLIDGDKGKDTLAGGAGNDKFQFSSALNGTTNVDTIADMNEKGNDTIWLVKAGVFAALLGTDHKLTADEFLVNDTGKAADAEDRIIFDQNDGKLYYDANGSTGAAGTLFAIVDKNITLTTADFYVV